MIRLVSGRNWGRPDGASACETSIPGREAGSLNSVIQFHLHLLFVGVKAHPDLALNGPDTSRTNDTGARGLLTSADGLP